MATDVDLGGSRVLRWWPAVFGVFWCSAVGVLAVQSARRGDEFAWVQALGVVVAAAVFRRCMRASLSLDGDTLVIRNNLRTRRIRRAAVERIWVGPPNPRGWQGGHTFGHTINLRLRDGRWISVDGALRLSKPSQLTPALEQLQRWQRTPT